MKRLLPFKALLFDLDGVITDTRDIHFKAWKKLFDQLLHDKGRSELFTEEDYRHYLDGKPREDGITSFLNGHQLHISKEEFLRLAAKKNEYFISILQEQGIRAFPDFLKLWEDLQDYHIKKAVVSSSENCRLILNNLGIEKKFDCIFDGKDGKRMMLKGKPAPDYFLKAASLLDLIPQECAVIEDALNGVEAAKKGNFQIVYGISRKGPGYKSELKEAGADKIIKDLSEIIRPPNALSSLDDFFAETGSKELAIFLDYDGTLSEIVSRPEDAVLRTGAKSLLNALSRSLKLAIVSGRDRIDVKERVGVDDIFYAGSHGFDMSGPGCFRYHYEGLGSVLKELEDATLSANNILTQEEGVHIERKAYATAIHYRLAPPPSEKILRLKISQLLKNYSHLKLKEGKKVFELIPDVEWGKGKAVEKLIDILGVDTNSFIPLYIGDDTTDEDAFTALQGKGISIRVDDDEEVKTHADFSLKNPEEVVQFLNCVLKEYAGDDKRWRCGN